jgi:hypothetical protein
LLVSRKDSTTLGVVAGDNLAYLHSSSPCLLLVRFSSGLFTVTFPPALGCNPEVEWRHIKLWISSAEVLETLLNSRQRQRGEAMLADVGARARLYVHTAAHDAVLDMLARQGVCILPGPRVGKSFLAQMALLAAAQSGRPTTAVSRCCPSGPAECVGLMPVRRSVQGTCRYRSAVPPSWVPVARTAPVRGTGAVRCRR